MVSVRGKPSQVELWVRRDTRTSEFPGQSGSVGQRFMSGQLGSTCVDPRVDPVPELLFAANDNLSDKQLSHG